MSGILGTATDLACTPGTINSPAPSYLVPPGSTGGRLGVSTYGLGISPVPTEDEEPGVYS